MLNAHQDRLEAEIVARAGDPGITVATNMAGRGTDVRLAPESLTWAGCTLFLRNFMIRHASIVNCSVEREGTGDPGSFEAIAL